MPQLEAGEDIQHPALGVVGLQVTPQTAVELDVDVDQGVYVLAVQSGSAAAEAGIESAGQLGPGQAVPAGGDVILEFGGEEVTDLGRLRELIDQREVGEMVTVLVLRDGEQVEVEVTLEAWEVEAPQPQTPSFPFPAPGLPQPGIR
ncbi:MAG: PDZ domain-containing protein [Dehalococcoidia bacterium]|nr:PDZ domain-containing protein [Dehalococcoidia bacterium]